MYLPGFNLCLRKGITNWRKGITNDNIAGGVNNASIKVAYSYIKVQLTDKLWNNYLINI